MNSSGNPINEFFKSLAKVELLSMEEEQELGKKLFDLRERKIKLEKKYKKSLAELAKGKAGVPPKVVEEARKIDKELAAVRRRLVEANLRLVVSIAKNYSTLGVPLPDLIGEGILGLMKAVEKFDYRRGIKFSTYATLWIKQFVLRAVIEQSKLIRVPIRTATRFKKILEKINDLAQRLEREPTYEEIEKSLGESAAHLFEIAKRASEVSSLDMTIDEEESTSLIDMQKGGPEFDPLRPIVRQELREEILRSLGKLTEKERKILIMRHGLDGGPRATLAEIGKMLHLSKERVRQLEKRALKKLAKEERERLRIFLSEEQ